MIRIYTDTSADLTAPMALELGVERIALPIEFPDGPYETVAEADYNEFYDRLRSCKELPHTSQPPFGVFLAAFENVKERGDEAIVLTLSAKISGTYESGCTALSMVDYDKINIVDTKSGSVGQQLLVRVAVKLRNEGKSRLEIVREIERLRDLVHTMAAIDTLTYLRKGGRIPAPLAIIGNAIKLKPLIHFDLEGNLTMLAKDRGTKASHAHIIKELVDGGLSPDYPVIVGYSSNPEIGLRVKEQLAEQTGRDDILFCQIGGVIGTHIGTDCVALAGVVDKRN